MMTDWRDYPGQMANKAAEFNSLMNHATGELERRRRNMARRALLGGATIAVLVGVLVLLLVLNP